MHLNYLGDNIKQMQQHKKRAIMKGQGRQANNPNYLLWLTKAILLDCCLAASEHPRTINTEEQVFGEFQGIARIAIETLRFDHCLSKDQKRGADMRSCPSSASSWVLRAVPENDKNYFMYSGSE